MFIAKQDAVALGRWSCMVQVLLALAFGASLIVKLPLLPKPNPQGLNISWLSCWLPFLALNAVLWLRRLTRTQDRTQKDKAVQTVAVYFSWVVSIGSSLSVLLAQGLRWKGVDTITTLLVGAVVAGVLVANRFDFNQASTIGLLALGCKTVPQVMMALSGRQLLLITFGIGATTITARLIQVVRASRGNWDSNARWSFVSEGGNGLSWLMVGLVSLLG